MNKEITFETDFADAKIIDYQRESGDCNVRVRTWNDQRVNVQCIDTVGVKDTGIGDICKIIENIDDTSFLDEVLLNVYDRRPDSHPYRQFDFINLDDKPCLRIVSADIKLSY